MKVELETKQTQEVITRIVTVPQIKLELSLREAMSLQHLLGVTSRCQRDITLHERLTDYGQYPEDNDFGGTLFRQLSEQCNAALKVK